VSLTEGVDCVLCYSQQCCYRTCDLMNIDTVFVEVASYSAVSDAILASHPCFELLVRCNKTSRVLSFARMNAVGNLCSTLYSLPFPLLPPPFTCFVCVLSRIGYLMLCPFSHSGGHSCGEAKTAGPHFAVVGYQTRFEAIPGSFVQTAEDVGSCTTRTPVQRGRYRYSACTTLSLRNG